MTVRNSTSIIAIDSSCWNQYGGNIGGPVKEGKVFFFFNYEGAQVVQQQQVTGNVPTPALLAQVPAAVRQTLVGMYPATYTPRALIRLALKYQF